MLTLKKNSALNRNVLKMKGKLTMNYHHDVRLAGRFRQYSKAASIITVLIGCSVFIGWMLGIPLLKSIMPGWIAMSANTAVAFIFLGNALWLIQENTIYRFPRWLRFMIIAVCTSLTSILALANLIEYFFGLHIPVHELLFKEAPDASGTLPPNRMAFTTALSFLLLSVSILLLSLKDFKHYKIPQILAMGAILLGYLTFTAYIYGITPHFEGLAFYTQMAANTSLTFMVLGTGVVFARPRQGVMEIACSDSLGGMTLRRLLPSIMIVNLIFGGFILWGELKGLYGPQFRISISFLFTTIIFTLLTFRAANFLYHIEKEREQVKQKLQRAELEIKQAMMVNLKKNESIAHITHELRSPLHSIIAGSSMMLDGMLGELNQKQEEYLDLFKQSSEHLLNIINDILDIAKIDAGKLTLKMEKIPLQEFIQETCKLIEPLCHEKNQKFYISLDENLPDTFHGDPTRLKQVLCNLLTNAVKFTPAQKRIWLKCTQWNNQELLLCIKDEGPGIPESEVQRVLLPFEQGSQANESKIKGTGLGLPLAQKLVNLHKGRLEVKSLIGKGCEFMVFLPLFHLNCELAKPIEQLV